MEIGFEKANSNNLPKIDFVMVNEFFVKSSVYRNAEVQNVKMARAAKENYGDNAVGHVHLKREKNSSLCIVKAKITPEHRVTGKGYAVSVVVNEKDEEVISCECHDCTASAGGCKHAVAFLMWLHRRSEEPSVTEVVCYWRTSKLSKVGKTLKACTISEMYGTKAQQPMQSSSGQFRQKFVEKGQKCGSESLLVKMIQEDSVERISLHCLSVKYNKHIKENNLQPEVDNFIQFCSDNVTEEDSISVQAMTVNQWKTSQWYKARFGRITASRVYEASRCQTFDGSFVESIFGSSKIWTESMQRGINLEESVLQKVSSELNLNINKCGFIVKPNFVLFGASPDGITEEYCIEVKCPTKEKTVLNYITADNKICQKPFAQLQLQMFLSGKKQGLLCVASPNFEVDNSVQILETELDEEFCMRIMNKAAEFWKNSIFPKIVK